MNDKTSVMRILQDKLIRYDADALVDAVLLTSRNGQLREGTRLPTINETAKTLGLSTSTVSRAWANLVQMGLIETRRRGGTFVARPVEATSYRIRGADREQFRYFLSPGYPDTNLQVDLAKILKRVAETTDFPGYSGNRSISDRLYESLLDRVGYTPDSMLLDTEIIGALPRILQAVSHRGAVIGVGNPDFPLYGVILKQAGTTSAPITFTEDGYDLAELDELLRSGARVVLLQARVHNPTGRLVPVENLEAIASILRRRDATAIEIDHHGALAPEADVRLARLAPERTVLLRSFSKDIHPDIRVSAITGPGSIIERVSHWRAGGQWVSSVNRALLEACLTDSEVDETIARSRAEYDRRRAVFHQALERRGVASSSNVGLSLWVPVASEHETSLRLASHSVSVAQGAAFATAPNAKPHVHLSLGCVGDKAEYLSDLVADAAVAVPGAPNFF